MFILIDASRGASRLEQPEELRKFHVEIEGELDEVALAAALAPWGKLEGDHAWIAPAALREAAAGRVDEGWGAKFQGMVDYAASRGWCDAEGRLRAHLQRSSVSGSCR